MALWTKCASYSWIQMMEMEKEKLQIKNKSHSNWMYCLSMQYIYVDKLYGVFMISARSYDNDRLRGSIQFESKYLWLHHTCTCTAHIQSWFFHTLNSSAWPVSINSISWEAIQFSFNGQLIYSVGEVVFIHQIKTYLKNAALELKLNLNQESWEKRTNIFVHHIFVHQSGRWRQIFDRVNRICISVLLLKLHKTDRKLSSSNDIEVCTLE